MPHKINRYDYSGKLVEGIFFRLESLLDMTASFKGLAPELYRVAQPPGTVTNYYTEDDVGEFIYGVVHYRRHPRHDCPLDPSHETAGQPPRSGFRGPSPCPMDDYFMELYGGPDVPNFVNDTSDVAIVIDSKFRDQVSRSSLTGVLIGAMPVPADYNQTGVSPELFYFKPRGPDLEKKESVVAPNPNECPFCGWGPVVCPACKHVAWDCPHCKYRLLVPPWLREGPADRRFVYSLPEKGFVLEGELWDGSDVFGLPADTFVTGRFVEFALRCGAKPFAAVPRLVDVSRCNAKQLARLEAARFRGKGKS